MRRILFALLFLLSSVAIVCSQGKLGVYAVAFYNLENLYDTENDPNVNDEDFTPEGVNEWTPDKYKKKLDNLSFAISKFGREHCAGGVSVLGVCEIENRKVLEDLTATPALADMNLGIVHYDSPDRRGVDVALLYNTASFKVLSSRVYPYVLPGNPDFRSRDQLLVTGLLGGEKIHVIVCHWPSRYGDKSSELRENAASISKRIIDSIHNEDINAKIILMGDLNDDPTDISCRVVLKAKKKQSETKPGGLFNTMWEFYDRGIGSLAYQNKWSLFDQIIISYALLGKDRSTLKFWKSEIFNRDFLHQKEGRNKGYPMRTYSGNQFINGYSDHFPTLIYLIKNIN